MLADRALLQSVGFAELAHRLAVFPRAQAEHQLLPHGFGQRLAAVEHFVAAQPHFLVVGRPHARPLDRYLLAHHHAVAALATPPAGRPFRLPLAALTSQFPNFFLHQQIHQLQAGLTNQLTHAFTQPAHHLGHGQDHLHGRISIRGHCLKLLYSSLRFNLVWFLHSDSFFSAKEIALSLSRLRAGSRYFLRSTGHSRGFAGRCRVNKELFSPKRNLATSFQSQSPAGVSWFPTTAKPYVCPDSSVRRPVGM